MLVAALGAIVPTLLQGEVDIRAGALVMLFSMLMWAAGNLQVRRLAQLPLLYVVIASSILAYAFWYKLINRHGINAVVNYVLLQPLITMLVGYWLLQELMSPLRLLGGGVTLLAMWCFYRLAKRS